MRCKLLTILLLLSTQATAGSTFFRSHDADSVVLGPLCAPSYSEPKEFFDTLDFDTPSDLVIEIYASGDGVDTSYSYSGGNIDDYDGTPPAWGAPTTSAVEVEADGDCIRLHIRDEVLAVANATEWTIRLTESTHSDIMDTTYTVLDLATESSISALIDARLAAYDVATESNVDANETKIDTIDTVVDGTDVTLDSLVVTVGTAGAGLTGIPYNSTWDAEIQSEVTDALNLYDGPTDAEFDSTLAAIDTLIDAIKAKTDSLTFTVPGEVDSNAESMNGAEILGDGTSGNKWRGE